MAEPLRELGSWAPAGPARDAGPAALRGRSWVRGRLRGLSWGNRPHFGADQPRRSMRWADVYVCMLADGVALRNRCPQGQADPRAAIAGGASGVTMAWLGPARTLGAPGVRSALEPRHDERHGSLPGVDRRQVPRDVDDGARRGRLRRRRHRRAPDLVAQAMRFLNVTTSPPSPRSAAPPL